MQKQVSFKSSKGYLLKGILHVPKGQGPFPTVIVQHGFKSNHHNSLIKSIAQNLEKSGFIVLRFTFSGHKPSGGNYKNVLVSQFVKDVKAAINFLLTIPQVNKFRIGMAGHSMGAFTALISSNIHKKYIRSAVSVSSLYDPGAVVNSYKREKKIDEVGEGYWMISGFKVTAKHFDERMYLRKKYLVGGIYCPVLIIHGNKDKRVQIKDAYSIYKLLNGPKELKIIKGADHNFHNQKHARRVVNLTAKWFKKYLVVAD
ncbi:alpha/beta fold hydrolase [Patescibacteria group bacterium]|nr:alpha/beta fold hydrolase [Patescibacteria group bacterium]